MSKIFQFHPLTEIFPAMEETVFETLAEDIRANGLQHPITLFEGMILDGRARYRACRIVGRGFRTKQYKGRDPRGFVVSSNLHRRHLTTRQRSAIRADLTTMAKGSEGQKMTVLRQWRLIGPRARQELLVQLQEGI